MSRNVNSKGGTCRNTVEKMQSSGKQSLTLSTRKKIWAPCPVEELFQPLQFLPLLFLPVPKTLFRGNHLQAAPHRTPARFWQWLVHTHTHMRTHTHTAYNIPFYPGCQLQSLTLEKTGRLSKTADCRDLQQLDTLLVRLDRWHGSSAGSEECTEALKMVHVHM